MEIWILTFRSVSVRLCFCFLTAMRPINTICEVFFFKTKNQLETKTRCRKGLVHSVCPNCLYNHPYCVSMLSVPPRNWLLNFVFIMWRWNFYLKSQFLILKKKLCSDSKNDKVLFVCFWGFFPRFSCRSKKDLRTEKMKLCFWILFSSD